MTYFSRPQIKNSGISRENAGKIHSSKDERFHFTLCISGTHRDWLSLRDLQTRTSCVVNNLAELPATFLHQLQQNLLTTTGNGTGGTSGAISGFSCNHLDYLQQSR